MQLSALPVRRTARRATILLALFITPLACRSGLAPVGVVVRTIEVSENRVPCTGVGPRECLQVRPSADAAWELFYSEIVGFPYEPGHRWVLRVAERPVANPPADGSSIAYTLLSVVSKTPAPYGIQHDALDHARSSRVPDSAGPGRRKLLRAVNASRWSRGTSRGRRRGAGHSH